MYIKKKKFILANSLYAIFLKENAGKCAVSVFVCMQGETKTCYSTGVHHDN